MVKRGFTLIELMIAILFFVILTGVVAYVFHVILYSWYNQETRAGIDIDIDSATEEAVRDIREAKAVSSVNSDEIRFTADQSNYYIYYLYNADDSYPPAFDESSYDLRRAPLTGGISGSFTYGTGKIIVIDVVPPPTSDLSISGNMVTIDLTVTRGGETVRSRTKIRPRNL